MRIVPTLLLACALAEPAANANAEIAITPDVVYGHKAGMALTYDVFAPKEPNGLGLAFMMSGGWYSGWTAPESFLAGARRDNNMFHQVLERGYTLYVVRHGSAPRFKVPEAVADVRKALRHIRDHAGDFAVDPNQLGVFGGSAGGHLTLMLAVGGGLETPGDEEAGPEIGAAVSYFPPTMISEFFQLTENFPALDFDPELADAVSPLLHATGDDAPTLLIHGAEDELVPLEQSERMLAAFHDAGVPASLKVFPDAAHGFSGDQSQLAIDALISWFEKHLEAPQR